MPIHSAVVKRSLLGRDVVVASGGGDDDVCEGCWFVSAVSREDAEEDVERVGGGKEVLRGEVVEEVVVKTAFPSTRKAINPHPSKCEHRNPNRQEKNSHKHLKRPPQDNRLCRVRIVAIHSDKVRNTGWGRTWGGQYGRLNDAGWAFGGAVLDEDWGREDLVLEGRARGEGFDVDFFNRVAEGVGATEAGVGFALHSVLDSIGAEAVLEAGL